MMAVGYRADSDVLEGDVKETELAAYFKTALSERFYAG
jgi:hypothetical protein